MGFGKPQFDTFHIYGDRYINKKTGETANTLTRAQRHDRAWKVNYDSAGAAVPNHVAVGWGNYADPNHPNWEMAMAINAPKEAVYLLTEKAASARKAAGYGDNAFHPGMSPNK